MFKMPLTVSSSESYISGKFKNALDMRAPRHVPRIRHERRKSCRRHISSQAVSCRNMQISSFT